MKHITLAVQSISSSIRPRGFLWLSFLFVLIISCQKEPTEIPVAENGILEANGFFSRESRSLYLDGEWDFFPNEIILPQNIQNHTPVGTVNSPGLWKHISNQEDINYATYRLRIVNHQLPSVFSLRNHQIYSAFVLYLNGAEVLANGKVSTSKEAEIPCYLPQTVSIYTKADTLDFVLHISNHHYRDGGIMESFIIGKASCLLRNTLAGTGRDFFLVGSLLIMALYYLSLFFVIKKERSSLFFSLFIFVSIIRILVTGQRLLLFLIPSISWDTMLRLEYGAFYAAPIFFILFFNAIFREEVKKQVVYGVLIISGLFTLLIVLTPVAFFTSSLPWFKGYIILLGISLLYWLFKAYKNTKEGALVLLLGIIVLFATLLHDMSYANGSLRGNEIFPVGLFLFILCQSYVLSIKFSIINKENHNLWEELDFKNQNLGLLVEERTNELLRQKELLVNANKELEAKKETMTNQSQMLEEINELLEKEKEKTDELLLNVLPQHIAHELKTKGKSIAHSYPLASVMFVDFIKFSEVSEKIDPNQLLNELHYYFGSFDDIVKKYNLEKIKTIGDAYMCVGGIYEHANEHHVINTVKAALEMQQFIQAYGEDKQEADDIWFNARIGIHTGPVIAGVVGKSKFAFDIWGATVNVAKNMEAYCELGKVNISEETWKYVKEVLNWSSRGTISMKSNRTMNMYYVTGLK